MIHTSIEKITPAMAREYLRNNTNNRNMRKHHVLKIANDIKKNHWIMNGASIVFNGDGTLLDGQHRLAAIVEADIAVEAIVIRGISKSAMPTIDGNVPRSASDVLGLNGLSNTNRLAAAARMLIGLKSNSIGGAYKRSNSEIIDFINRHPKLVQAQALVEPTNAILIQSATTPWYYLAAHVSSHEKEASAALSVLISGVPLYDGDPIHTFRERAIRIGPGMRQATRDRYAVFFTLVSAWNDFLMHKRTKICRVKTSMVEMLDVDYSKL